MIIICLVTDFFPYLYISKMHREYYPNCLCKTHIFNFGLRDSKKKTKKTMFNIHWLLEFPAAKSNLEFSICLTLYWFIQT